MGRSFRRNVSGQLQPERSMFDALTQHMPHSFKVTEVALMIDWEDSSAAEEEADDKWNLPKAVTTLRDKETATPRGSMRGLQLSLSEGWIIQRARDMCSFAHDRYRQAAQAEADALPEENVANMSFRVGLPPPTSLFPLC